MRSNDSALLVCSMCSNCSSYARTYALSTGHCHLLVNGCINDMLFNTVCQTFTMLVVTVHRRFEPLSTSGGSVATGRASD